MKKGLVLLFGLVIITGSFFPLNFKVSTTPLDIVKATAIASVKNFKIIPVYVPGSINLDNSIGDDFSFTPTKRRAYYLIPSAVIELVPEGTIEELFEKDKDILAERQEMALVTLIKYCNISEKDFKRAIVKELAQKIAVGIDITQEEYELPNADIIYTFDNVLINYYYRRA